MILNVVNYEAFSYLSGKSRFIRKSRREIFHKICILLLSSWQDNAAVSINRDVKFPVMRNGDRNIIISGTNYHAKLSDGKARHLLRS